MQCILERNQALDVVNQEFHYKKTTSEVICLQYDILQSHKSLRVSLAELQKPYQ